MSPNELELVEAAVKEAMIFYDPADVMAAVTRAMLDVSTTDVVDLLLE